MFNHLSNKHNFVFGSAALVVQKKCKKCYHHCDINIKKEKLNQHKIYAMTGLLESTSGKLSIDNILFFGFNIPNNKM